MKIINKLKEAPSTPFSIEIIPPPKGQSMDGVIQNIEDLLEAKPAFVDVTYHREEYIYKKHESGLLEKVSTQKRPGTVGICAVLQHRFQVDAVPHIICGGFRKEEIEDALIDLDFLGIKNILAIRGDAIKSEPHFRPEEGGHRYASELLKQIQNLNKGQYLHEETLGKPTSFCVGVAGYPEKHVESPSIGFDMKILKEKVKLGASYIITQMFFDNQHYHNFVKRCRKENINIPIIPGLKPITSKAQLHSLARHFFVSLPEQLVEDIENAKTNRDVQDIGIQWCIEQSKDLIAAKAPCIHYYTMGKAQNILNILRKCF